MSGAPHITEIETNPQGGKGSRMDARYDLLSPLAIERLAQALHEGAEKYTPWNWLKVTEKEHINHALGHIFEHLCNDPEPKEDHLGHAFCRLMMAIHVGTGVDEPETGWYCALCRKHHPAEFRICPGR